MRFLRFLGADCRMQMMPHELDVEGNTHFNNRNRPRYQRWVSRMLQKSSNKITSNSDAGFIPLEIVQFCPPQTKDTKPLKLKRFS